MTTKKQRQTLSSALCKLLEFFSKLPCQGPIDERSCKILNMIHAEGKSYEEVSESVGLAVVRIKQLEVKAFRRLEPGNISDFLNRFQKVMEVKKIK